VTAFEVSWERPGGDVAADLTDATAAGVARALGEIGFDEPAVAVAEQHGDELTLRYGDERLGPSAWVEQCAYGLAAGWEHPVPDEPAQRWAQAASRGTGVLATYVRYWAYLECHWQAASFVAAARQQYDQDADDDLVQDALRYLLRWTTAPLPEKNSLRRHLRSASTEALYPAVLGERLCADAVSPVSVAASASVIAQLASDQRAVGGVLDYVLVERLGPLAEITPPPCFVVDDVLPEGWLIVRHGRRPMAVWPVPPPGCFAQGEATPVRMHLPWSPETLLYAADGGTVIDYLADALAITMRAWASEMASTRQAERILASLASTWDATAVDHARQAIGLEVLTHALRRWIDAGRPVTATQLLVRELLANAYLPVEQALDAGFAAAVAALEGPPELPLVPPQPVSDEVPIART
jgi:hypothetical protein